MKRIKIQWTGREIEWIEDRKLFISVPFTWNLPSVQKRIASTWYPVVVGGPAVELMPGYLRGAEIRKHHPGVLQKVNPLATRTTIGCPGRCAHCGVGKGLIEGGGIRVIRDFIPNPVIVDNNILASPLDHLDRVASMIRKIGWADFQGIDVAFVTKENAAILGKLKKITLRTALDSQGEKRAWGNAHELFRSAGIAKGAIRAYVLCGYKSSPDDAWERCRWIEKHGASPSPMWFHELNALERDVVTEDQEKYGWTDHERKRIMRWFYKHRDVDA